MLDKFKCIDGGLNYWIDGLHFDMYVRAMKYLQDTCGYSHEGAHNYLMVVEQLSK